MQKRKRAEAQNDTRSVRRFNALQLPEVVDIDVLGTMQDQDLFDRLRLLEEERMRVIEACRQDPQPWEEEIAYIKREQQVRRARRDAHADISRREVEAFNRQEAELPNGDFDNTAYVNAAGARRARWN